MIHLPAPPDAYWVTIPWWGYFAFFITGMVILVILGPVILQMVRRKPSAMESREQLLAQREKKAWTEREEDLVMLRADVELGWGRARAMEIIAHQYFHALENSVTRSNWMLGFLQRVATGKTSIDVAAEVIREYTELTMPAPVPKLDDVAPVAAADHKYG
jgi:hypothetical protein